ncbi:DNA-binding transcriptional LysR family regulator [Pseudoduganella lurida]|uniref:DNA-binding transcriptional LysR family regulator n=1 Tax=Pseudoduganella lurida TaxID=1036180 RepID=A0A562RAC8_9BURK|nr:LysR substrate-binding domain-containing protein [Pseudoduganella lurida]TWI65346.1 DNA-binding transcriptional LysR family regulator [Pseudoduganella lurida]
MELRHLRYFVAVAEELSFTRAADRLHIGQPPLSQQIQALEHEVGARLLDRNKRRVLLTEAGKLFLDDARRVLALADQAKETARRAERGEAGQLKVGFTYSTPFTPLFATVVRRYRQLYPGVLLTFVEMATLHQLEKLEARELDLGFVRTVAVPLPDTVKMTSLRTDPLRVVLPADSPLARQDSIAVKDLAGQPFVVFPKDAGTGIYPQLFRLCRAAGFTPQIAMEAGEASTIIGLVAAGCGISVLPSSFEGIHMEGVVYRPLADPEAATSLLLAQRTDGGNAMVAAFVALAREAAAAEQ